jgi:hypothetical protein
MTQDSTQQYDYVRYSDQAHTDPNRGPDRLADMVEIRMDLVDNEVELEVEKGFNLPPQIKISRRKELPARTPKEMLLTFSNLCVHSGGLIDTEFAAFYELLVDPPEVSDRLIPSARAPKPARPLGGDCFLAATVSV